MMILSRAQCALVNAGGLLLGLLLLVGCSAKEIELCAGVECAEGQVCVEQNCVFVGDDDCSTPCASTERCENGRCVVKDGVCNEVGQRCDASRDPGEGFLCIDWTGESASEARCTVSCPDHNCPEGSACYYLGSSPSVNCSLTQPCKSPHQRCVEGQCMLTACRPSQCEGDVVGDESCTQLYKDDPQYADGAKCYMVLNGASYCFPAGQRGMEEPCDSTEQSVEQGDFTTSCGTGLVCHEGLCKAACVENEACEDERQCIGKGTIIEGMPDVGICASVCRPFEQGQCASGMTCYPITSTEGQCQPAGELGLMEACEIGGSMCMPGLHCAALAQNNSQTSSGRCLPLCNTDLETQALRDASCPQAELQPAYVQVVHLAQDSGPVDIYLDDDLEPVIANLSFEDAWPLDSEEGAVTMFPLEPRTYAVAIRSAGAPATDAPRFESRLLITSGHLAYWVIVPPERPVVDALEMIAVSVPDTSSVSADEEIVEIRFVNAIPDSGPLDVVLMPAESSWSDDASLQIVATELRLGTTSAKHSVVDGKYDVYVFAHTLDQNYRMDEALLVYQDMDLESQLFGWVLYLRGTLKVDDYNQTDAITAVPFVGLDATQVFSHAWFCNDRDNGVYGVCQQVCADGAASYHSGLCLGDGMGCVPRYVQSAQQWKSICEPVGSRGDGEMCQANASTAQCAEGYYCLTTGSDLWGGMIGRCEALCSLDESSYGLTNCTQEKACKPLTYSGGFDVGECAYPCTPDAAYSDDESCPEGMKTCRPLASLQYDYSGVGQIAPWVREEQAFCGLSGTVQIGNECRGNDCVAGSECLFSRSVQQDFVGSMLSPYFGSAGQVPTCRPYCDPFTNQRTANGCGAGETCLFNFPWNADVGHCAKIEEVKGIDEQCSQPGLACGKDSICTWVDEAAVCMRYCQYTGGSPQGAYEQSTCPSGYQCAPLVNNIGYCTH